MDYKASPYNNYNPDRGRYAFETASLVLGTISVFLLCTGVLAIPAGALGALFALLSRKGKNALSRMALCGLILSLIGMITGGLITAYAVYAFFSDPSIVEDVIGMYERYGMEVPPGIEAFRESIKEGGSL